MFTHKPCSDISHHRFRQVSHQAVDQGVASSPEDPVRLCEAGEGEVPSGEANRSRSPVGSHARLQELCSAASSQSSPSCRTALRERPKRRSRRSLTATASFQPIPTPRGASAFPAKRSVPD